MSPAGALKADEQNLIKQLEKSHGDQKEAMVAVLLVTRKFYRTKEELLDLIASYPGLENLEDRRIALNNIIEKEWVTTTEGPKNTSPRLRPSEKLEKIINDLADDLSINLNNLAKDHVSSKILGHMGDDIVYDTFISQLKRAQSDIILPMVSTSSSLEVIDILKERAQLGVRVRVLRATPKLASQLRGNNTTNLANERRKMWKLLGEERHFTVRETGRAKDLRDASSMLIDDKLLRYPIYDETISRSTEGTMLEVSGSGPSNITRMYYERFEEIWSRASPLDIRGKILFSVGRAWRPILFSLLIASGVLFWNTLPNLSNLIFAAAVGFLVNQIDSLVFYLRNLVKKLFKP